MKKGTLYILCLLLVAFSSCKKDGFDGVSNSVPEVAVTFSDTYLMNNFPVVATSYNAGGAITFKLNIPANSGRTIKEITRVATGTSGTAYLSLNTTASYYYNTPVAGSGTSASYSTTLAEYVTKTGGAIPTEANRGSATAAYLARYFFFLVTLDNGQQIKTNAVRVYVNK
ncbi:hypothetical protein [Filimonas effusa]|uniref:Uncharacterized protein n=1 Tax=Filimonas effusa TaxID=2508721 RepID=A0A4V1MA04_9BACT|nr:hypothetical protein [Filimonas effusa]RXK83484.1 hypothetical protein ESB13_15430 [Filimonas effusa]